MLLNANYFIGPLWRVHLPQLTAEAFNPMAHALKKGHLKTA